MTFKKITFILLLVTTNIFAWNQVGHKVVAQIAYDNLTPQTKTQVDQLTQIISKQYPGQIDFIDSSIWPDDMSSRGIKTFAQWHYINIPINADGKKRKYYSKTNVVWAINQAQDVLTNPNSNAFEKALFLRFLIHFVGDIHQPLHTSNYYSKRFRHGDKGGNLYAIQYGKVDNLHSLWDQCFTLTHQQYPSDKAIITLAHQLETEYPKSDFVKQLQQTNPQVWAYQGHKIATDYVYKIPYNARINKEYQQKGQVICQKQLALAGYRLADLLNQVLGNEHEKYHHSRGG